MARTITRADAAAALDVPVGLVDAYVQWGLLLEVPAPGEVRVTIASVGALLARRRSQGRALDPCTAEPTVERRPVRHAVAPRGWDCDRLVAG